jgi:hypothetical protein
VSRRHNWAYSLFQRLEYDPDAQFRFHKGAIIFWAANGLAGTALALTHPHLWTAIGVLYVFWLSLYANADTDFGAMTAASAAKDAKRAADK